MGEVKEYMIKEKLHTFKKLKSIEIDLAMIGFSFMETDEEKWEKIKEARMLILDVFNEVNKELEELKKRKEMEKLKGKGGSM